MSLKGEKKRQSGFSLVGVVVAGSLLTIIGFASSQMILRQVETVNYLEDKLSKNDLKTELVSMLSVDNGCLDTLSGRPIRNTQILNRIRNVSLGSEFNTGNPSSMEFDKIQMTGLSLINVNTPNTPNSTGRMTVVTDVVRNRTGGGPKELASVEVEIIVQTDGASRISSCNVSGLSSGEGLKEGEMPCIAIKTTLLPRPVSNRSCSGFQTSRSFVVNHNKSVSTHIFRWTSSANSCPRRGAYYRVTQSCNNRVLTQSSSRQVLTCQTPGGRVCGGGR